MKNQKDLRHKDVKITQDTVEYHPTIFKVIRQPGVKVRPGAVTPENGSQ